MAANVVANVRADPGGAPRDARRGRGTIVDVTSHTATADPPGPVGRVDGGWPTPPPRRPSTGSPRSWPWSSETGGSGPTTSTPGTSTPSVSRSTRGPRPGRPLHRRPAVGAGGLHRLAGGPPRSGGERPDGQGPEDRPHPRTSTPTGARPPGDVTPGPAGSDPAAGHRPRFRPRLTPAARVPPAPAGRHPGCRRTPARREPTDRRSVSRERELTTWQCSMRASPSASVTGKSVPPSATRGPGPGGSSTR